MPDLPPITGDHPIIPWLTWQRRAWLYAVMERVSYIFIAYGIGSADKWALIVGGVGAVLGVSVAGLNTSVREPINAPASENV